MTNSWFIIIVIIIVLLLLWSWYSRANAPEKFSNSPELILYASETCHFCKIFMPEFDKFILYSKSNFPHLKITKIFCNQDSGRLICEAANIQGYPTVILKSGNSRINFSGQRTSTALIQFVQPYL